MTLAVLVGCGSGPAETGSGEPAATPAVLGPEATSTTFARSPSTALEAWKALAPSPLSARSRPVTAWTGRELLVWRGAGAFNDGCTTEPDGAVLCGERPPDDGAAYDPAADSWRLLPPGPMPPQRSFTGAEPSLGGAWTGRELVVVGGEGWAGAAYDPEADRWRSVTPPPLERRRGFSTTWTGGEVVVWGGVDGDGRDEDGERFLADGAAYDPAADRWRPLPAAPSGPRAFHGAVWTGREVLVLGGSAGGPEQLRAVDAYDPVADRWRPLAAAPAGPGAQWAWTGDAVVVVGAGERDDEAASYDPAADRWTALASSPLGDRHSSAVAWTGREVVVVAGQPWPFEAGALDGAAYDPAAGTWRSLPPAGLAGRSGPAAAWTGAELLVWGGELAGGFTSQPFADGGRYAPGR